MPYFLVEGSITVSAYTLVEADTPEAAMAEARGRRATTRADLGGGIDDEHWSVCIVDEIDGSLTGMSAVETDERPEGDDDDDDDDADVEE